MACAFVFTRCKRSFYILADLLLPPPPPPLGGEFSVQATRKLTYTIKKTFVINKEGYYIWIDSKSALKDLVTSEFYPLNHATKIRELDLATRICTRLESPFLMKQKLHFAFRLFSNCSVCFFFNWVCAWVFFLLVCFIYGATSRQPLCFQLPSVFNSTAIKVILFDINRAAYSD